MLTIPTAIATEKRDYVQRRWMQTQQVLGHAVRNFLAEDSLMVSGSIAYHSLLAIFPLLLLLLGVSGLYIRRFELTGHLSMVLQRYLPIRTDIIMQNLVGIAQAYGKIGLLSCVLLLWSSSGVFMPLERAVNRAWDVQQPRAWWKSRLLAAEMAVVSGGLMLMAAALVGFELLLRNRMDAWLGPSFHALDLAVYDFLASGSSFGIELLMFVVLFERLPNRPMKLRQALPGALLTATLWEAARWLFIVFLPYFNYRLVYGSIGVVVSLMTWAYISSAVILFGAQVSRGLYRSLKLSDLAADLDAAGSPGIPNPS